MKKFVRLWRLWALRKLRAHIDFQLQQLVRLKSGPFADQVGKIAEINEERSKLKVLVDMFGRETPVEIDFTQVEEAE